MSDGISAPLTSARETSRRSRPSTASGRQKIIDYFIVGAGPAGLQLGYFLQRAGRHYAIAETGSAPGTFFATFPRHRQMISINKPHTGESDTELTLRWDWNSLLGDDPELRFTRYTELYYPPADDYRRYLSDFAQAHRLNVFYNTRITDIARAASRPGFTLTDAAGKKYRARRVVIATGFTKPYVPPIPGIELAEQYSDVSIDPQDFVDQRVLVIGKGNSAFETANHLTEKAAVIHIAGPSSIKFAWRTHFIGHLRAVNNTFLDTYQLKTQNSVLDCTIERIEWCKEGYAYNGRRGRYRVTVRYLRRDSTAEFVYDRVIACTSFRIDPSIFAANCKPRLTIRDRFPELTHEWESVNVPDLYFAGTLTQSRDFKKYTSAFIHGFRYGIRALTHILEQKYERVAWPWRPLPAEPRALADAALERLNRTSALWQQFHFMSDVIVLETFGAGGKSQKFERRARYYEEIPVDYAQATSTFSAAADYFLLTLEYGPGHDLIDPFDVDVGRQWESEHKRDDRYLHPVIRHYRRGVFAGELRLPENIDNDWTDEVGYRSPLASFIADSLAGDDSARVTAAAMDSPAIRSAGVTSTVAAASNVEPRSRAAVDAAIAICDVEPVARERLNAVHYDYFAGGAQDEVTVRANEAAFRSLALIPRVLRGAGKPVLETELLGCRSSMPIILAPTAFHCLAHPEGERATARAAASADTIMISAMLSTVAIEEIAAEARKVAADPQLWFQLYIQPDLGFTEVIVRRAEAAGCKAFVVTVDSATLGRHRRNDRNNFHDLPPGMKCENLRIGGRTGHVRQVTLSPDISWDHIDWLRKVTNRPLVLKAVLHSEDARIAADQGIAGLIVSNHGGRQLDTTPATIEQLPHVVAAVDGRMLVLLDGGVRHGTDVVKALTLGAGAVAVGRPIVWGLAADGEAGVSRVLEILRAELAHTLTLCGARTPKDLTSDQVRRCAC